MNCIVNNKDNLLWIFCFVFVYVIFVILAEIIMHKYARHGHRQEFQWIVFFLLSVCNKRYFDFGDRICYESAGKILIVLEHHRIIDDLRAINFICILSLHADSLVDCNLLHFKSSLQNSQIRSKIQFHSHKKDLRP